MTEVGEIVRLADGLYRVVDRGPALAERQVQKGKRATTELAPLASWIRLEKIGPPEHDRGSPTDTPGAAENLRGDLDMAGKKPMPPGSKRPTPPPPMKGRKPY